MLIRCILPLFLLTTTAGADDLAKKADALKPTEAELGWQRIPWLTSLVDGERVAKKEKRPILYWNVDDDPLERC